MTKSAGMTRLQLADNEPFKLDAAEYPRWCADSSCAEMAHQPFLFLIAPMTLAWDANFNRCPGLGASLFAVRGSLFVRLLHMDTVMSWSIKDSASLLAFLNQTEFQKNWANDEKDIILNPTKHSGYLMAICRSSRRSCARVRSSFRRRPFLRRKRRTIATLFSRCSCNTQTKRRFGWTCRDQFRSPSA